MKPSDQELYDQLLGYLAAEGEIEEDPANGLVILTEFNQRALERPLRLHLTPSDFGRHLREASPDAAGLYPDVAPVEAAWRLFTVHLDEAIQTARPSETELMLVRGGLDPVRPDGTRAPLLPEVDERNTLNEYYERLIQHYAYRGELEVGIGNDVLTLHRLDGRTFDAPLRIHLSIEVLRKQMRTSEDPEAAWQDIVDQIDDHVHRVDPRNTELELGPNGIVTTARSA